MPAEAIFTLVVGAVIIAAAALALSRAIIHLANTSKTLSALDGGVQVIVDKTATVPSTVASVNASLAPVRAFADTI